MNGVLSYKLFLVALISCGTTGDSAAEEILDETKPLTETCLYCLCEAQSGCNATAICVNGACGLFRITWRFWVAAGKPTIDNESSMAPDAFTNCVNEPYCAANSIQNYMYKYGQDCNDDGKINCYDYGAMHKLGNRNCRAELPYVYAKIFHKCLDRHLAEVKESA